MTTITLDLEKFIYELNKANAKTLGWTWLNPNTTVVANEPTKPSYVPTPPAVMASFSLVDNQDYRFTYTTCRYARFNYLLERNGSYEAGELTAIHNLVITPASGDELSPPVVSPPFTPPTITTYQTVSIGGMAGSLGILFSFIHDTTTSGAEAKFGLAFKITNALPAVYPRLTMSYISVLAPEDI